MPSPLLLSRRFAPLFWCQFFAAFNDNFLKTALVFVILFQSGTADAEALITLASAVFIAPFFFLSALGGQLADRYDKAKVAQRLKFVEIFIAALAVLGYARSSLPILFVALFAFGVLAALFGPIKYGILPDHLRREQLPSGNALIEGATFVAILLGTIAAGLASRGGEAATFAALVISFALRVLDVGLVDSCDRRRRAASENRGQHRRFHRRHDAAFACRFAIVVGRVGVSWFWLVGIVVLSLLPPLIKTLIGGNEETITAYLALFSIAVGVGSGLAAAIARGRIVLRTTLVGAVLLGAFALDLGFATLGADCRRTPARSWRSTCVDARARVPRSTCAVSQLRAACSSCRPLPQCRPGVARIAAREQSPPSISSTRRS